MQVERNRRRRLRHSVWILPFVMSAAAIGMTAEVIAERLEAGFSDDPRVVSVRAGGDRQAGILAPGCAGFVADSPTYTLEYSTNRGYPLRFFVESGVDTTLAVSTPGGDWMCNDDYAEVSGVAPGVTVADAESGRYDVWVGVYDSGDSGAEANLLVTELDFPWAEGGVHEPVVLSAGFHPDPQSFEIQAGGSVPAYSIDSACEGHVNSTAPDFEFQYEAGRSVLSVYAESDVDLVLIVEDPSSSIRCSDDFSGSSDRNPGLRIEDAESGLYRVWVGTYSGGAAFSSATLFVSEAGLPSAWSATSSGTGFFVSEHHLLTNRHVTEACSTITATRPGRPDAAAELVAENEQYDLALLFVDDDDSSRNWASFRDRRVRLGEGIMIFGFPERDTLSSGGNFTDGVVSGLSGVGDDLARIQFNAAVQAGSSGSAVLDRAGDVVAVAVSRLNGASPNVDAPQAVNFGVRSSIALAFLEVNGVNPRISDAEARIEAPEIIANRARSFTTSVLCNG